MSVYEPMHIDSINLKFKGFEQTKLVETRTTSYTVNGQTRTRTERFLIRRRVIFRRRVDLHNYKATLNPGMYVYPFRFRLDDNIPGTFSISQGDASGSIVYKLKAEVVRPGMFNINIKHTQMLHVSTRFDRPIQKVQVSQSANVTKLLLHRYGEVKPFGNLDKSAYTAGEVGTFSHRYR